MELHLYIDTKPVIYGQDLSFICYSDGPAKTSLSSWYWFKNDRILFQDGSPRNDVDSFKYNENRVTENIRNLTISDFEFSDIQNYKCRHAFKEAILDLDTEASKFVCKYTFSLKLSTFTHHIQPGFRFYTPDPRFVYQCG